MHRPRLVPRREAALRADVPLVGELRRLEPRQDVAEDVRVADGFPAPGTDSRGGRLAGVEGEDASIAREGAPAAWPPAGYCWQKCTTAGAAGPGGWTSFEKAATPSCASGGVLSAAPPQICSRGTLSTQSQPSPPACAFDTMRWWTWACGNDKFAAAMLYAYISANKYGYCVCTSGTARSHAFASGTASRAWIT